MKKLASILQNTFFAVLFFSLVACEDDLRLEDDTALVDSIANVIKTCDGQEISLKEVTNFEWDKVIFSFSYDSPDSINARIGYDWELSELASYSMLSEGITLLVFTKKRKVSKYLFFPRNLGDFIHLKGYCYSKDSAIFKVKKHEIDGMPWYDIEDK